MTGNGYFDVVIIGGSYAGLSAAMALGRSLRSVLIIDSGLPCNRQTPRSHNFITQDGEAPGVIAQKAKAQVLRYSSVQFLSAAAIDAKQAEKDFTITITTGETFTAKKLIFATGIKDIMPGIHGFEECWGISVIHCPYCHGYEFRGQKTAIMSNGNKAFHIASLVNNLTTEITLLTQGKAAFTGEELNRLQAHNIRITETAIAAIEHEQGQVKNVVFTDGSSAGFDAVYAAIPFIQHSDIPVSLGCELTEQGYIKTDTFQKTSVAGIFACGDNAGIMRSVASAVASGNIAGAMVNHELTQDAF
jgi:thioredoxin reductase